MFIKKRLIVPVSIPGKDTRFDGNPSWHHHFICEVVEGEILKEDEPLTYAYYHEVKRGVTPKKAPTYREEKEQEKMQKYRCIVCGYIYDPQKGDPESDIKPGTAFEKLPDSWVCPICGVGKDRFEEFR